MLTAHQRIQIARHFPDVVDIYVRDDRDVIVLWIVRLRRADGSEIAVYGDKSKKCLCSKLTGDYSEKAEILRIDPDLRERLVAVFGPMTFREPE